MLFNEKLRIALAERKMTQEKLADILGLSRTAVNSYCNGRREPSFDILKQICIILDESADYLIGVKE